MQLTRLEQINRKKYRIYLNDEAAFLLYADEISEYHIREGIELTKEQLREIEEKVLGKRAKMRCMDLLMISDKTEQQLIQKLRQEEYPEAVIGPALDYVKSFHYVDDLRYAENYIESRKASKSRRQICSELKARGVSGDVIEQAWWSTEPADETVQILRWAEKKHFDKQNADDKERQRFYQFLLRKGFLFTDIKKALT